MDDGGGMKLIALTAAGLLAFGATAHAASSTDAVRAVQTASQGVSHKAFDLDRDDNRWEVKFADGTERHVTLDGRRVTRTTPRRRPLHPVAPRA